MKKVRLSLHIFYLNFSTVAQCSKCYEISNMEFFQITKENPDPPTNQGAYFNISLLNDGAKRNRLPTKVNFTTRTIRML